MLLKRIQLSGFKSFADKIVIGLEKGITGIVGPNGSGKSNVIDAVRWVMGEQNAKTLRGKVATDIIFAGSSKRKALGMAEVSLVFDNSTPSNFCPPEYRHESEIVLTRRLYVDGQREFLINKKNCRLKDITNFFAISGLGGKSYSMIQQGAVERILNAKPEDIRVILEEAAGTIVYKIRRDETLKRFENTNENLNRINDIISELDRQHSNLKTQMEKAKKWNEYSARVKNLEMDLFYHDYHKYSEKLTESEGLMSSEKLREAEIMGTVSGLEQDYEMVQEEILRSNPDLQLLNDKLSSIRESIGRYESTIEHGDEKVEINKKRLEELERTIEEDCQNLKIIESQAEAAQEEVERSRQKARELQESIDSFQDEVDSVEEMSRSFDSRKEDLQDELRSIDRLLDNNSLRTESINRDRQKLAKDIVLIQERQQVLQEAIKENKLLLEEKSQLVEERQAGLKKYFDDKEKYINEIRNCDEKISQLEVERNSLKDEYWEVKSKLNSAVEVESKIRNVGNEIKRLMSIDTNLKQMVFGSVEEYVEFDSSNEGEIVQSARRSIEKWLECVLVKDIDSLNYLARLVKNNDSVSFPVRVLNQWKTSQVYESEKRNWVDKVDAVCLGKYLKIKSQISDELRSVLEVFLQSLYYLPCVSLGEEELQGLPSGVTVFSAQGLVIEGIDKFIVGNNDRGHLSRKEELNSLEIEVEQREEALASVQSSLDSLNQKQSEYKVELSQIEDYLSGQNQQSLDVISEFQSVQQVYNNKLELADQNELQLKNLLEEDSQLVEELEELGEKRIQLGSEQDRVNNEIDELSDEFDEIQEKKQVVFRQHEKRKQELAKAEGILSALRNSSDRTKEQLEVVQSNLSRKYSEKSNIELEIEDAIRSKAEAEQNIQSFIQERESLVEELRAKSEANSAIIDKSKKLEAAIKALNDELRGIQTSCFSKDKEMERMRVFLENIEQQAMEKYSLDLNEWQHEIDEGFDADKAVSEIKSLKNKIEHLGSINMMAIDEYEVLVERQTFLNAQRDEIVRSIAVIQDALEEIEEVSKNKFIETFERVNREFLSLFPILFPGGEARLDLTTPQDPLNSGVEILARLPGKKLQRMSLMSGGEKSLTAISLIFALLKTKPTPFCFLDEVDAPLDEANVGRFNNVLEVLSEKFQFIVITHNRRTMEIFDTLFGVTMQEPGVSKIVGVDMNRELPAHLQKAFTKEALT